MTEISHKPLMIPALKAFMGCWVYYIGFMKMNDIVDRISVIGDIHTGASLQDFLQRQLSDRSQKITDYLLNQDQRFFNSLVIGTYGGKPEWFELDVKTNKSEEEEMLMDLEGKVGFLKLSGLETLFAIDGQHRISGIKGALKNNKYLEEEEVSVIFVAGVIQTQRNQDPQGFERTRRLFTTLNRYAKPVNKKDIIALDEDDVVAIITRKLIEEFQLFKDKVSSKEGNSIQKSDKVNLTTIINLYDIINIILKEKVDKLQFEKRIRPSEEEIKSFYNATIDLFSLLIDAFEPLRELKNSAPEERIASKYRHNNGGHLLFRPIGLKMMISVIMDLQKEGYSVEKSINRLKAVEMDIAKNPWNGVIWNPISKRMLATGENQKVAKQILYYSVGGDLAKIKSDYQKLVQEIAGITNQPKEDIALPKYW